MAENLRLVDLSFNALTGFPGLSLARRLEVLNLRGNKISSLADFQVLFHSGVTGLREIDLAGNQISDPRQFVYLNKYSSKIHKLAVAGNPVVRSLHCKIAILQSIETLALLDGSSVSLADRHQARSTPMVLARANLEISSSNFQLDQFLELCMSPAPPSPPAPIPVLAPAPSRSEISPEILAALQTLAAASDSREVALIGQVQAQEREISDLHVQLKRLSRETEQHRATVQRASDEKEKQRRDLQVVVEAVELKDKKISDLRAALAALDQENTQLRLELRDALNDLRGRESEISRTREEISDHQLRRDEGLAAAADAAVKLERKTHECAMLEAEVKTDREKWASAVAALRDEARRHAEQLTKDLEERSRSSDVAIAALTTENKQLSAENAKLQSEFSVFSETLKTTSSALKAALEENLVSAEANKALTGLNSTLQSQLSKTNANQELLERACKEELSAMAKKVKMAESLSRELAEANKKMTGQSEIWQSEISRLSEDLKDKISGLAESEAARRAAVAEVASQIDQIAKFRKSETEQVSEISALRATLRSAEERERKYLQEISDLRGAFGHVEQQLDEYRSGSESEISSLRKERERISVEMANREALLDHLREQLGQKISECQRVEEERVLVVEKLKTSEASMAYVHEEMDDMRADFKRQHAEIAEREGAMETLKAAIEEEKRKCAEKAIAIGNVNAEKEKLEQELKQRDEDMKILVLGLEREKKAVDEKMRKIKELFAV